MDDEIEVTQTVSVELESGPQFGCFWGLSFSLCVTSYTYVYEVFSCTDSVAFVHHE